MNITSYIQVINEIPPELCDEVIEYIKKNEFKTHQWSSNEDYKVHFSFDDKEPKIGYPTDELETQIITGYKKAYFKYVNLFKPQTDYIQSLGPVRLNQYDKDSVMRSHFDHIHSLFDGKRRGIPVLSFVSAFNDDYQGGALTFNLLSGQYALNLKKGDVVIFPSVFIYEHEVEPIIGGTRYTGVAWGY